MKHCEVGCPGATNITNSSWVQELSKNRDNLSRGLGKQLTHIVRVIASALLFIILQKTISFKDYKSRY
jgi:hypothetical protein